MAFRIKIQGPLYRNRRGICTVRIEVSKREKVILPPDNREFNPPYTDILPYMIYIMQNNEILAEKVRAIYTRQKARDLYDLYKLIEMGSKLDIDLTNKKLKYYDLKFKQKIFIENCKRLRPHWESELQSLMEKIIPYNEALTSVRRILSTN